MILVPQSSQQSSQQPIQQTMFGGSAEPAKRRDEATELLKQIHSVLESRDAPNIIKSRVMDDVIRAILDNPKLSADEKATAYAQALQKQRLLTKQHVTPTVTVDQRMAMQTIIDSVPKSYTSKAERLMSFLDKSDVQWTSKGEIIDVNGQSVPKSNMADLVNDLMRSRKAIRPEGRDVLATLLQRINVPREFIGNDERWKAITKSRDPIPNTPQQPIPEMFGTPETPPGSPQPGSTRPRSSSLGSTLHWEKY